MVVFSHSNLCLRPKVCRLRKGMVIEMIAANNKYLTEAANTMHELYSDREMRRQMENREDFIRRQKRDQRMLKDQADIIAEQADEIAEQADEIAKLQAQIESLKKSL